MNVVYNMDCMEGMKQYPDKYFDLAIVDPPYGLKYDTLAEKKGGTMWGNAVAPMKKYHGGGWDIRPCEQYFQELIRVSKNQIIWGGNYFIDYLKPSKSFVCWDKRCLSKTSNNFADCEFAYMSESLGVARMFRFEWTGMLQGDMAEKEKRIHPTQKPVALYEWLLRRYAKEGDKILDTHVGSGSSRIACEKLGFDFVGYEIDEYYWQEQEKRFQTEKWNIPLF